MPETPYTWRGGFCLEVSPVPSTLVIFGAGGDLAARKLFPALFQLQRRNLLHEKSRILSCARQGFDDESWRARLREMLLPLARTFPGGEGSMDSLDSFLRKNFYLSGDYREMETYEHMAERLELLEQDAGNAGAGRIFYLSTAASVYADIVERLHESGLSREGENLEECCAWRHIVLEKPFGYDLASARRLDARLHRILEERQIYRIDHYLGKETVQNILMFRFANLIFESVWNRNCIDSVQITVAETVGVEHRANYFEGAGLLRDMFQNHMLEMLSLVAMEMPSSFEADAVRDEKLKLLRSIRPPDLTRLKEMIVRAQYTEGRAGDRIFPAYREEPRVNPESMTETYVAAKLFIDNWRWHGVPFYLRSGKRMPAKCSEIVIQFKPIPHSIFKPVKASDITPNRLILTVQPEEGLSLTIQAKQPGPKLCMGALNMDFKYSAILEKGESMPDAYERLLLDCMLGDQTLFIRSDTIELAWSLLTPILNAWEQNAPGCGELFFYPAASWGPDAADNLIYRDGGRVWHNIR